MADAITAIKYVLENEGGYCNVPGDSGGPTNFGLSQKFLVNLKAPDSNMFGQSFAKQWQSEDRIKRMTRDEAIEIYQVYIWKPIFAQIESQDIANYYFDMVVNHGESQATKILQRSLSAMGFNDVVDDGILGPFTLARTWGGPTPGMEDPEEVLLCCMKATRAQFYRCLAQKPGQDKFLKGWLSRAYK